MHFALSLLSNVLLMLFQWIRGIVLFFVPEKYLHKEVTGEIVLITGGGSGLGQLTAIKFAKLGAIVVTWDVNEAGNAETCRLIKKNGGIGHSYYCDVSNRKSVYEVAKKVKDEVGIVTILINNAGIVLGKQFMELEDEKLEKVFNVNTLAHFWTVKAFLPDMIAADHGHLVFISSIAGLSGSTHLTDYCSSKFAVVGFDEALKLELRSMGLFGIHSTVVCPYFTNTGLFDGVTSNLIPLLEPAYVSEKIVSGILCEKEMILVPWYMLYLLILKWILPSGAQMALYDALGGNEFMASFTGRIAKGSGKIITDMNENGVANNGLRERIPTS